MQAPPGLVISKQYRHCSVAMQRICLTLSLALTVHAGPLCAQTAEDITVTGEPLADREGLSTYGETVIIPDNATQPSARLEQLLSSVAGFQPFRRADTRSSHPTANGLALRGLGGNAASRAGVLLDGVPIADPFGGWVSWNLADPASLAAIKVMRGGGLVSSGPGTLTGLVSLQSKGAKPETSGEIAYGSRDALSIGGVAAGGLGRGAAMVSARFDRGDGFVPVVKDQRGSVDRRSPYKSGSARLRGIAPLGGGELQANIGGFYDRRERGTPFTDNNQTGGQASLRYVTDGKWGVEALAYVSVREFNTSFARIADDRNSASQALDQSTDSTGVGGKIELRPPLNGDIQIGFGGDFSLVDGTTRERASFQNGVPRIGRVAGGENGNLGLYLEADWKASDQLLLTGGFRSDLHKRRDGRLIERDLGGGSPVPSVFAPERNDFYLSGRIGARLDLGDGLAARAAAYRSHREPTLNELYRPYRVGADGVAANAFLDPERLTGGELGLDWQTYDGAAKLSLTGFYAHLDNTIADVTLTTVPGLCQGVGYVAGACQQRQNLDAIRSKGLELEASYRSNRFDARFSAALTDAKLDAKGSSAALDGKRPAQVPEYAATFSLGWQPVEQLRLYGDLQWQDSRFDDEANSRSLGSFARLDLGASYAVTRDWEFGMAAENIFDETIETAISGDGLIERANPRTVWFSLRYRK